MLEGQSPHSSLPVKTASEHDAMGSAAINSTAISSTLTHSDAARSGGVTPRVVLLCLTLAVVFGYVIPYVDLRMNSTFMGTIHLPPGAVAVLLVMLLVVNPLSRLLGRRFAFSRSEVLTVYIASLFATITPGWASDQMFLMTNMGAFYYATRENAWLSFLEPYLKPWFSPALRNGSYDETGRRVIEAWYIGIGDAPIPWDAWLVPLFAWGTFIFASYVMVCCISVMLRAQWAEHEALSFPLLRLPLEMTEDLDRSDKYGRLSHFFRNPLMWCGFSIAAIIQLLNGLNLYFPDVPRVPLELPTWAMFTEPPWNQIGWTPIQIFPIAIGISYLLPTEISFSFWFFFWFINLEYFAAYYAGFPSGSLPNAIVGEKLFTRYQTIGVFLAYVGVVLWTAREHFKLIARRAFGRVSMGQAERSEALSYPVAFWGFVLSFSFVVAWTVAAGVRPDLAFWMRAMHVIIIIGMARVVIESGLLFIAGGFSPIGALAQLTRSGPGTWLSPENGLVPAAFLQGSTGAMLMPSFIHGFKLAHDHKIRARPLLALVFAIILISMVMSFWMYVRIGYIYSGLTTHSWFAVGGAPGSANFAKQMLTGVPDVSWMNWLWMGSGVVLAYLMMLARSRFLWFPLHPLGLVVSQSYYIRMLWPAIFIGWLCKIIIIRYGGNDTYRKTTPAFLGLILGDVAMMLFWIIIDAWQGRMGHRLMPA
jgi:hypothetical protein